MVMSQGQGQFSSSSLFVCKYFNSGHSFSMLSGRAFIFHIYIPWDKTLSLVPKSWSSVKVKIKYQGQFSKKWPLQGHSCFTNTSCFGLLKNRDCVVKS